MAITDKEEGVWILNEVYAKQNEGDIWSYTAAKELWSAGNNNYGRLGLNDTTSTSYSSPVQIFGGGGNWFQASYGRDNTTAMMAMKSDGSVWSWGDQAPFGSGGRNVPTAGPSAVSSPVQIFAATGGAGSLANSGSRSVFYRDSDGQLWAWGANSTYGELGLNSKQDKSSPTQVGTDTTWSNNLWSGSYNCIAAKTDGTLWTWGANGPSDFAGALGQGNKTNYSSPRQVGTDTTWATGRYQGSAGTAMMACVKTDGTLWTWGKNPVGVLGHNNNTDYSSPRQLPGTTWSTVSISTYGSCMALKTDGSIWGWGDNYYGQLGLNTQVQYSSPKQIGTGTDWKFIIGGGPYIGRQTAAIKTDGTLWVWGWQGQSNAGNLGQNNITQYSSPMQIPGTWSSASLGDYVAGYITDK